MTLSCSHMKGWFRQLQ